MSAYVTLPRRLLALVAAQKPPEPVPTISEVERWLWREYPGIKTDKARRSWAKELLLLRWLVKTGRYNDGR